jgi:hypothetical protein
MSLHSQFQCYINVSSLTVQCYINVTACITEMVMPPHCQFSFSIPATACISAIGMSLYCQYIALFLSLPVSHMVIPLHCQFNAPLTIRTCNCLYHSYGYAPLLPFQCFIPVTACTIAVVMPPYCQFSAPFKFLPVS